MWRSVGLYRAVVSPSALDLRVASKTTSSGRINSGVFPCPVQRGTAAIKKKEFQNASSRPCCCCCRRCPSCCDRYCLFRGLCHDLGHSRCKARPVRKPRGGFSRPVLTHVYLHITKYFFRLRGRPAKGRPDKNFCRYPLHVARRSR